MTPPAPKKNVNVSVIGMALVAVAIALWAMFAAYASPALADDPVPTTLSEEGTAYAVLCDDGQLLFVRSTESHSDKEEGTVTDIYDNEFSGTIFAGLEEGSSLDSFSFITDPYRTKATSARVADNYAIVPRSAQGFFNRMSNLMSVDLSGFDFRKVTRMTGFFASCPKLHDVDLDVINTQNVLDITSMFSGCKQLETLDFTSVDTSSLTTAISVFDGCTSLTSIDMTGCDMGKLTTATVMFSGASKLQVIHGIEDWNTQQLSTANAMFNGCSSLKKLDLHGWKTSNLRQHSAMFDNSAAYIDISTWNLPLGSQFFNSNFSNNSSLVTLIARNLTAACESTIPIYRDYSLQFLDLSGSSFPNASLLMISYDLGSLTNVDLSNTSFPKLQRIECAGCENLTTISFSGISTPLLSSLASAFANDCSLRAVDLSSLDTANLTNVSAMFSGCSALQTIDFTNFTTGQVTDMSSMFKGCQSLSALNLSGFDTHSVTTMDMMFNGCESLTTLDISSFDTDAEPSMANMFSGCQALQTLRLGDDFEFSDDPDSLPGSDWVRIEDGDGDEVQPPELATKLWRSYNPGTMSGTYRLVISTIGNDGQQTLPSGLEGIAFDADTGEVTVYVTPSAYVHPVPISLPFLSTLVELKADLANSCPGLAEALAASQDGTYAGPSLSLSVKSRLYADIIACSKADGVIWTFDLPKDKSQAIRMDIWEDGEDGKPPYEGYVGHIENTAENPTVFTQYDAEGQELDVLTDGRRHNLAEVWHIGEQAPSYDIYTARICYPAYEDYLSYDANMRNYEAVLPPGRYRIEISTPGATNVPLAVTDVLADTESDAQPITGYMLSMDDYTDPIEMTVFNAIRQTGHSVMQGESHKTQVFRKIDKLRAAQAIGVGGAVYSFESLSSGRILYGVTDAIGYIHGAGNIDPLTGEMEPEELYDSIDADLNPSGEPAAVLLGETFVAREVKAPEGYYINDEETSVTFYQDFTAQYVVSYAVTQHYDGVSIKGTDEAKSLRYCYTCQKGSDRCTCGDFGECACENCGTVIIATTNYPAIVQHQDVPRPYVRIDKVDDLGVALPGATLQIVDADTQEVVAEWVTNGTQHSHQFTEDEVANLSTGNHFVLREKSAPASYFKSDDIEFDIAYDTGSKTLTMTDAAKTSVSVSKAWHNAATGSQSAPDGASVTFELIADGSPTGNTVTLDGVADSSGETSPWVATFSDLRVYPAGSTTPTSYAVREVSSFGSYSSSDGDVGDGGTITNTLRSVPLPASGLDGMGAGSAIGMLLVGTGAATVAACAAGRLRRNGRPGEDGSSSSPSETKSL